MAEIMTGRSEYFSLRSQVEKLRRELTWGEFLYRHRAQLEPIADIVCLGCLWADPYTFHKALPLALKLEYKGKAKSHQEAAKDLSRIMEALCCSDLRLSIRGYYRSNSRPDSEYTGQGVVGSTRVEIEMQVSWLPEGCTVRVERGPRECTQSASYSVYCRRV